MLHHWRLALIAVALACGGAPDSPAGPPPPPPPAVTTVEVSPPTASIVAPGELTLTATVKDQSGNALTGKVVAWTTTDATIATVASDGRVSVIRAGSASITATVEGKAGSATITGLAQVARLAVSRDSLVLAAGDTVTLVATPRDAQGNPLTQRTVTWQSPDPTVATITAGGLVSAVGAGRIVVTARAESITTQVLVTVSRAAAQLPPASCTSCLELVPASALLRRSGAQQLVEAYSVDASGRRTRVRPTWQSSHPADVRVDANGLLTAVSASGSAQVTATANGMTSAPAVILVADPADGALVVRDAQVALPPVAVDTTAQYGVGYRYRVRLRGVTPTVGQVVLAAENQPIGGRVTSVTSAGSGLSDVVLEVVPASGLFKSLKIKQKITLAQPRVTVAAGAQAAYQVSRDRRGTLQLAPRRQLLRPGPVLAHLATTPPGQFMLGNFECQISGSAPSFPLTLTMGTIAVTPSSLTTDIDFGGPNPSRMLVLGDVDVQFGATVTVNAAIQESVNCKNTIAELHLPFGGPLSLLIGGTIPLGLGFDATMAVSAGGFGANITYAGRTSYQVGYVCGLVDCPPSGSATTTGSATFAPFGPPVSTQGPAENITVSAFAFADVSVSAAIVPSLYQIQLASVQAGFRHVAQLAGIERQRADSTFGTFMGLFPFWDVSAGVSLSALGGLLNLPLVSRSASSNFSAIVGTPRGRWNITQDTVAAGIDVSLQIAVDSVPLSPAYEIASAEVRWYKRDQTGQSSLQFLPNGCGTIPRASPTQTLFSCTFQFTQADTGWQYFHAFTLLRVFGVSLPLPFEVNRHAIDSVYVTLPSIRISPRSVSVPVNQIIAFSATVTGTLSQVINWTASGGTITPNGVFRAGSQAGTFRVFASSPNFPSLVDTAIVTVTAVTSPLGITGTPSTGVTQGAPFSFQFGGVGGNGVYAFSASGLPPGITMASNGLMSGTPTQAGTFSYTVIVQSAGVTTTRGFTIVISPADPWLGRWVGTQTQPSFGRTFNRIATLVRGTLGPNRYQLDFSFGEICFLVVASDNTSFTGTCTDGFLNVNIPITGTRSALVLNATLGSCPTCTWTNGIINLTKQ